MRTYVLQISEVKQEVKLICSFYYTIKMLKLYLCLPFDTEIAIGLIL